MTIPGPGAGLEILNADEAEPSLTEAFAPL